MFYWKEERRDGYEGMENKGKAICGEDWRVLSQINCDLFLTIVNIYFCIDNPLIYSKRMISDDFDTCTIIDYKNTYRQAGRYRKRVFKKRLYPIDDFFCVICLLLFSLLLLLLFFIIDISCCFLFHYWSLDIYFMSSKIK